VRQEERAVIPGFLAGLAIGLAIVIVVLIVRSRRRGMTSPGEGAQVTSASPTSTPEITDHSGLHLRRQVVKQRMVAKVTPDGLTVTIDGQDYHRLEDIPDPARAAEVRTLLASTTASVTDPTTRASMEKELRDIGIEPDGPSAG
jgi:hypothetical protein